MWAIGLGRDSGRAGFRIFRINGGFSRRGGGLRRFLLDLDCGPGTDVELSRRDINLFGCFGGVDQRMHQRTDEIVHYNGPILDGLRNMSLIYE